jgi:hypothetical protein
MKLDDVRPFETLDPPPGGAERFRERLEQHAGPAINPSGWLRITGLAASLTVVAVIAVLAFLRLTVDPAQPLTGDSEQPLTGDREQAPTGGDGLPARELYQARQFDRLLGRPMQPAKLSVVINDESVAVAEIPSANARVRLYQIQRN